MKKISIYLAFLILSFVCISCNKHSAYHEDCNMAECSCGDGCKCSGKCPCKQK